MSIITILADALDKELQERGVFSLSRADCEAVITRVFQRTADTVNRQPLSEQEAEEISRRSM
jgi:hypothetical protein